MGHKFNPKNQSHAVGYSYAFFWWGLFAIYCIVYQIDRARLYYYRRNKLKNPGTTRPFIPIWSYFSFFHPLDINVRIPFVTEMIPLKHILGTFFFCAINMIWAFLAPFELNEGQKLVVQSIGRMDIRLSYLGMVNWSIVVVLALRNNVLTRMSGLTFEHILPFHRMIARVGMAEYIPHFVYRIIVGYQRSQTVKGSLFRNIEQGTGTVAMIGFIILFATSFEFIRRNFFRVFYYSHIVGIIIALAASCWHEQSCFYYFLPAIIFWIIDRLYRSYQSWCVRVNNVKVDPAFQAPESNYGTVRILFEYSRLKNHYHPGQYVFVSIARKTKTWYNFLFRHANWHPFTVSEVFGVGAPTQEVTKTELVEPTKKKQQGAESFDDVTSSSTDSVGQIRRQTVDNIGDNNEFMASLHIKTLGPFTRQLLTDAGNHTELDVRVDGPYGARLEYQDYPVMAAFAAGIGITPALTLIRNCVVRRSAGVKTVTTEQVYLTWAVQTISEVDQFADILIFWLERCRASVQPLRLTISIYITRQNKEGSKDHFLQSTEGIQLIFGRRPDIAETMQAIEDEQKSSGNKVWIHSCGTHSFMRAVTNEAIRRHWPSAHETFEF